MTALLQQVSPFVANTLHFQWWSSVYSTSIVTLNVSMKVIAGSKNFACAHSTCERTFSTPQTRDAHEREHVGDLLFECSSTECDQAFKSAYECRTHELSHTGAFPVLILEGRTLSLQICGSHHTEHLRRSNRLAAKYATALRFFIIHEWLWPCLTVSFDQQGASLHVKNLTLY